MAHAERATAIQVRRAAPEDWKFIRDLCCKTGNAGAPIAVERWKFFAQQWIGPYERLARDWAYVASGERGEKLGYLTGCPDTSAFEPKRRYLHDLPLFVKSRVLGFYRRNGDVERFERRFLGRELGPEQSFDPEILSRMKREYPAHLHMNVEEIARGTGAGRRLYDSYRRDLLERGIHGIHLFCGPNPLPFYAKMGFERLAEVEFRPGVTVYALGARF